MTTGPSSSDSSDANVVLAPGLQEHLAAFSGHASDEITFPESREETSAETAAKRMGIFGGEKREGSLREPRKPLALSWLVKASIGFTLCVPWVLCGVLFLIIQRQSTQLASLDAAFRHGQLQQLPAEVRELDERLGKFQKAFVSVQDFDNWRQSQQEWKNSQERILNQYVQSSEAQSLLPERMKMLEQRIDGLQGIADTHDKRLSQLISDWQTKWEKLSPQVSAKASNVTGNRTVKKSQRVTKPVPAPFSLTSIEHRGGQQYAVIIPNTVDGNRWSQIRMLTPGESENGWTLTSIEGNQARFQVNGTPQILTVR
ncbi:hypothetical protein [Dickeya dianthicola]|uniref:hypothetical protein n=1 Tax=Dickeya dianthicola TaxID=204039 RepID=UPI0003A4A7C5|nr:hypothetical protein [Dickeya dianthicola]MCI4031487.1 hypothetical protein [Dickeya dianthicola]MCI4174587.1 hypothetical protein [Dickeya dianthicola]MCI4179553.1 hypothetical protein [Dickeya dianthicola]MCI4180340.1 hypothetical protein [Dickeya dianthicola]MCI4194061.1 hypothetical protein [Dickeya dianthicola]